jgi:hypothetical protein
MRSPKRFGIKAGATTIRSWASARPGDKAGIHRPGFKADLQLIVPIRQSPDRGFGNGLFSTSPRNRTSPTPAAFRDRDGVLLLGDIKSHKNFAMLSHGPPSVHEARLGLPKQPSFLTARNGGPPAQPREHDV